MSKRGELSEREKKAFLESLTTSKASPEDAKHLRGVAAALGVFVLSAAVDGAIVYYAGTAGLNRGVAMLVVLELTAMAGAYRLASR
jgi:hypothetical protein